jgi:hypothetical protein
MIWPFVSYSALMLQTCGNASHCSFPPAWHVFRCSYTLKLLHGLLYFFLRSDAVQCGVYALMFQINLKFHYHLHWWRQKASLNCQYVSTRLFSSNFRSQTWDRVFRCFPHYLQANTDILLKITQLSVPSIFFPVRHCLSYHLTLSITVRATNSAAAEWFWPLTPILQRG